MFYPTKTEYNVKMWTDKNKTEQIGVTSDGKDVYLEDGTTVEELLVDDMFTPTVTHETTNFKVGVGDSDISQSVVDGEVAKMTIKGQTYQNILPEPSLRNSMANGKSMQKFNVGYDSVNVVDGVGKSVILSGNTLVNHVSTYNVKLTTDVGKVVPFLKPMDVTKKYLLKVKFNALPTFNDVDYRALKLEWYHGSGDGAYKNYFKQNVSIGKEEYFVIQPYTGEVINKSLTVWSPSLASGTLDIDVMIIEYRDGMENWDIPYFTGMTSCKMLVL